mmetsp:Transcript_94547/g.273328  ORF Transcript_94547/g.273328 Transcript_94547/m.273328 type:complete len:280 (+) Transcript_94547:662-1501(+)
MPWPWELPFRTLTASEPPGISKPFSKMELWLRASVPWSTGVNATEACMAQAFAKFFCTAMLRGAGSKRTGPVKTFRSSFRMVSPCCAMNLCRTSAKAWSACAMPASALRRRPAAAMPLSIGHAFARAMAASHLGARNRRATRPRSIIAGRHAPSAICAIATCRRDPSSSRAVHGMLRQRRNDGGGDGASASLPVLLTPVLASLPPPPVFTFASRPSRSAVGATADDICCSATSSSSSLTSRNLSLKSPLAYGSIVASSRKPRTMRSPRKHSFIRRKAPR